MATLIFLLNLLKNLIMKYHKFWKRFTNHKIVQIQVMTCIPPTLIIKMNNNPNVLLKENVKLMKTKSNHLLKHIQVLKTKNKS
jgi:hypothetical protein